MGWPSIKGKYRNVIWGRKGREGKSQSENYAM